jgi:predicted enzyme related to lactoylglutathione lyase
MAKVLGLGGVFVKAKDPAALCAWYREMLGIEIAAWGGAKLANEAKTYGVWSAFKADSEYFDGPFMINFRVDDADALVAELRAKGANVLERREDGEFGKFRYVIDPDGTLLELLEPKAP